MKKILIIISSLVAVLTLVTLQVACSSDDDDSPKTEQTSLVLKTDGFAKYGDNMSDSAKVSIIEKDESDTTISITLSTGLVGLSFDFDDVYINTVGDTSTFHAINDKQESKALVLDGKLYNGKKALVLTVTGGDLTDTVFFATDKVMLTNSSTSKSDIPTSSDLVALNAVWTGKASYDGADAVDKTFATKLDSMGNVTINLDVCKFSAAAPSMIIMLQNLTFTKGTGNNSTISGTAATYAIGSMTGSLPATITGTYDGKTLQLKIEDIKVGTATHSIVITDAVPTSD